MGKPPDFDPAKETEFLVKATLEEAEYDNTLADIVSTYDYQADRLNIGTAHKGPRLLNFAPILHTERYPLNRLIKSLLTLCEETFQAKVEIEFALTIDPAQKEMVRFGLLQVRPMAISDEIVEIKENELTAELLVTAADNVMGNGSVDWIQDVLYVSPETFQLKDTRGIAAEMTGFNRELVAAKVPYMLIGFGRWGSSDPWLGIPVQWGQISGARVIVESQLPGVSIDLSQGSHFFHNISNLGILYFSIKKNNQFPIDWKWLEEQQVVKKGKYVTHIHLPAPLTIKVDGRKRMGVILK
jgi:hypothetical protein